MHRTSWLFAELSQCGRTDLAFQVFCRNSALARAFAWPSGLQVHLCTDPAATAAQELHAGDLAIVDSLDSSAVVIHGLRATGVHVALFDDCGEAQGEADLVVNALLSPLEAREAQIGRARVLSGARFMHFPPEVIKLRQVARATQRAAETELAAPLPELVAGAEEPRAMLVSFGGSPVQAAIALAFAGLRRVAYGGKVIVMPAPTPAERRMALGPDGPDELDVEWCEAGPEFHILLAASDMAILAGGLTLHEAALLGVPAVCIALRGHQADSARRLEVAGACLYAGRLEDLTPEDVAGHLATLISSAELRGRMAARGMAIYDGKGLQRTVDALLSLLSP